MGNLNLISNEQCLPQKTRISPCLINYEKSRLINPIQKTIKSNVKCFVIVIRVNSKVSLYHGKFQKWILMNVVAFTINSTFIQSASVKHSIDYLFNLGTYLCMLISKTKSRMDV